MSSIRDKLGLVKTEIPIDEIYIGKPPVKSFVIGGQGITKYHCCIIKNDKNVKFRYFSDYCDGCISNNFGSNCTHSSFCGNWIKTEIEEHKSFEQLGDGKTDEDNDILIADLN